MKIRNKRRARIIRDYIIGWTFAFMFLSVIRGVGTIEVGSVQFELGRSLLVACFFGPFFGTISGIAQIVTQERMYRRIPLLRLLLLRLLYAALFVTIMIVLAYWMVTTFFGVTIPLKEFAFEPGSWPIYLYVITVDFVMNLISQINLMLGDNKLSQLLRGKFYNPREEDRIFMFLDLKSSTTLAEKLGHIEYSSLVQDCFNDLGVVIEYGAEIYQYVGDEAVLTWKLRDGLKNQNCLRAYYLFKQQLENKTDYYQQRYDCLPFFKAGMHSGVVTVTEIGKYKKEIAYHGDVLNTAARIQSLCNELGQEFLISEFLKDQLQTTEFTFEELRKMQLKGKKDEVLIYAVSD